MYILISYVIQAIQLAVNKGLFLNLWASNGNYVSLYYALVFILCFFSLVFILKKLYRW